MEEVNPENIAEFKIGDTVTVDRYNHIDDIVTATVSGYGQMPISRTLTYKMYVNGVIIESTGISIMESKYYTPVDDKERHHKLKASTIEIEEYWEKRFN